MNIALPKTRWPYIYIISNKPSFFIQGLGKVKEWIHNGTGLAKLKSKIVITKKGVAG